MSDVVQQLREFEAEIAAGKHPNILKDLLDTPEARRKIAMKINENMLERPAPAKPMTEIIADGWGSMGNFLEKEHPKLFKAIQSNPAHRAFVLGS